MEVDSVGIIAILSMSYITTRIIEVETSVAKIPRVPVENQIATLSVVQIAIKFSPCNNIIYFTKFSFLFMILYEDLFCTEATIFIQ